MKEISLSAHGKINLFLDIKGLRKDGFHELAMVMQSIKLHDNITISSKASGIQIGTNSSEIPTDQDNLAYQAAQLMIKKADLKQGVNIYIEKNIPVAAGLAGGSTDAAAVIKGMNQLFDLNYDYGMLHSLAAQIGSDVPFCLKGGTAYAAGRGEELTQLTDLKKYLVLLVKPPVMVSTKKAYDLYDKRDIKTDIPVQKLLKIIKNKKDLKIEDGWANILEPVSKELVEDIQIIKNKLRDKGLDFTMMTGSGPTVFALIKQDKIGLAQNIIENWDRRNDFITLTETYKEN